MKKPYQEGYLDQRTIQALRGRPEFNCSAPGELTATMWYSTITGTIYEFRQTPPRNQQKSPLECALVLFDELSLSEDPKPSPRLHREYEMNPGLETALASIKTFRRFEKSPSLYGLAKKANNVHRFFSP
ncbi:TPA: hypothetical protein HA278_02960 [Candidatus Woesearchaeota archaeon]|nr:hypothetical protein [Candidatus Woesearchaeota archaeon]